MKIDGNLKQAIRSACNSQPETDWKAQEREQRANLDKFVATHKQARLTLARLKKLREESQELSQMLCRTFGLQLASEGPAIASCDGAKERFKKAGGTLTERKSKWGFDSKMAEVAAATEKDALIILRGIGINWE